MRLAVVTTRMSAVNTFLERDLRGLMQHGVVLDLWLVDRGDLASSLVEAIEHNGGSVRQLHRPWHPRAVTALIREAVRAPGRLLGSIGIAMACCMVSFAEGMLALGAIPTALAFAAQLPATGTRRVHALWAGTPTSLAYWVLRHTGVPFGFSAHAWDIQSRTHLLARKAAAATGVVVCSRHALETLRALVAPEHRDKIQLVHHGIDLSSWQPSESKAPTEPPLILAVGRLTPKKGFEDLVRACEHLKAAGCEFRCEIVGPNRQSGPNLRSLISSLGLGDKVFLEGYMPSDGVRERMRVATVLVAPSITTANGGSDGIPNVVLEAMCLEVPVVATDAGGLLEVVDPGVTGMIVPQRDPESLARALEEVLADPARSRRMARAARARIIADFDIDVTSERLLDALRLRRQPNRA